MPDYVSPYLNLAPRSVEEALRHRQPPLRSRFVGDHVTTGGTPFQMALWNPTVTSLAAHFECEEGDIDIREDDETGKEIVSVNGTDVGRIEWF